MALGLRMSRRCFLSLLGISTNTDIIIVQSVRSRSIVLTMGLLMQPGACWHDMTFKACFIDSQELTNNVWNGGADASGYSRSSPSSPKTDQDVTSSSRLASSMAMCLDLVIPCYEGAHRVFVSPDDEGRLVGLALPLAVCAYRAQDRAQGFRAARQAPALSMSSKAQSRRGFR